MATNEAKLNALAEARARRRQDTEIPFLIHTKTARLLPNTPLLREHKDLVPYTGGMKDDKDARKRWLASSGGRRRVISSAAEDVFDVAKADAEQLAVFAFEEFGATLDTTWPVSKLRKQVMDLAKAIGNAGAPTAVAPPNPTAKAGLDAAMAS